MQNLAIRKILDIFKIAPIEPMEIEAALPPPSIRLNHSNRRYAFRALKLSKNHPIRVEFDRAIAKRLEQELGLDSDYLSQDLISPSQSKVNNESQIYRLLKSIYLLIDFSSLEVIKHFYFPP
jgi:hypothetical protein